MKVLTLLALSFLFPASSQATELVSLGEMRVSDLSTSEYRNSVELTNDANQIRLDCLDAREPTNTFMILEASALATKTKHLFFEGTSDFYCQGLGEKLLKNLELGQAVSVSLEVDQTIAPASNKNLATGTDQLVETVHITDIQFSVFGEKHARSLKSNAGTGVDFVSVKPVVR